MNEGKSLEENRLEFWINITPMFPGVGCSILLSKAITLFCRVERPVKTITKHLMETNSQLVKFSSLYELYKVQERIWSRADRDLADLFPSCCWQRPAHWRWRSWAEWSGQAPRQQHYEYQPPHRGGGNTTWPPAPPQCLDSTGTCTGTPPAWSAPAGRRGYHRP